jgi:hypothetical protein
MEDDDWTTAGDGPADDDPDIHAAKTKTAGAARIGMAARTRDARGI